MPKRLLMLSMLVFISAGEAQAMPMVYQAALDGSSESPSNASLGTGLATMTLDTTAHTLRVEATFTGLLGNVTAAHIHCCTAIPESGTAGVATMVPFFADFPLGVTSGTYNNTFNLTLNSSFNAAFVTAHGGTPAGAEAALAEGLAGREAYFNIHTNLFPAGEIRGFLQAVPEPGTASLLGIGVLLTTTRRRRIPQGQRSVKEFLKLVTEV